MVMPVYKDTYLQISETLKNKEVTLIAVSKTKPVAEIEELYALGHRDFGENYVQELSEKHEQLPQDIRWHFIGHLQTNKVKYIAPFVHLIHGVDREKLLVEINKQGEKNGRIIPVLLQVHIAQEETKFGFDEAELEQLLETKTADLSQWKNIQIKGLMGMASFTDNKEQVRGEFRQLKKLFDRFKQLKLENCSFEILSMGMSGDYELAVEEGSTMVRIGSLLFGARQKP